MPDALAVLAEDHRQVLELLNRLTGGSGEPRDAPRERKALAERLAIAESKHEAVEELVLWPVVRQRVEHGDELAARALEQEESGKELIHDLDHITAGDAEFMTLVQRLQSAVRDHISFEEGQVWPKLRLALSDAELDEMGEKMEAARRTAPTRPHPKTPPDPKVLGTLGPAVGTVDRVRDVLTGRGTGTQGLGRWRMAVLALILAAPVVVGLLRALVRSGHRAGEESGSVGDDGDRGGVLGAAADLALGAKAARAVAGKGGDVLAKAAKAAAVTKAAGALGQGGEALAKVGKAAAMTKAVRGVAGVATKPLAKAGTAALLSKAARAARARTGGTEMDAQADDDQRDDGDADDRHALGALLRAAVLTRGAAAVAQRLAAMLGE